MEEEDIHIIKAKIVISLQALLTKLKKSKDEGDMDFKEAEETYGKIATTGLMRKATIINIFNGVSAPKTVTLFTIIKVMGFQTADFAAEYDSISDTRARNYKLPRVKEEKK